MGRSQTTFKKREKEMKRKEKQERKLQRRLDKKASAQEGDGIALQDHQPDRPEGCDE